MMQVCVQHCCIEPNAWCIVECEMPFSRHFPEYDREFRTANTTMTQACLITVVLEVKPSNGYRTEGDPTVEGMQRKTMFALRTGIEDLLPVTVSGIGFEMPQTAETRLQGFPQYHWLYSVSGAGELTLEAESWEIPTHAGFMLRPDVAHRYKPIASWETHWITFDVKPGLWETLGFSGCDVFSLVPAVEIVETTETIMRGMGRQNRQGIIEASAAMYSFLVRLGSWGQLKGEQPAALARLQPVVDWMNEEYAVALSLEDMAARIQVSRYHLCRLFRTAYNTTPTRFLKEIRLRRAKEQLLQQPQLPVQQIGLGVGYEDPSYFSRVFKAQEGLTPQEFRRLYRS